MMIMPKVPRDLNVERCLVRATRHAIPTKPILKPPAQHVLMDIPASSEYPFQMSFDVIQALELCGAKVTACNLLGGRMDAYANFKPVRQETDSMNWTNYFVNDSVNMLFQYCTPE